MVSGAGLGDRERRVLRFVAGQRVVMADQVTRLFGAQASDVEELLAELTAGGGLVRDRASSERAACFRITRAGLDLVGSRALPPGFAPAHRHSLGVAWIWFAARGGTLGPVDRALSEREMRAEDDGDGAGSPFFVEPHEFGGRFELHYPDVVAVRGSERVAVEFLFAVPSVGQLEAVLRAYGADARVARVLFFVLDPWLAWGVQSVVASLELLPMVEVVTARFP